LLQTVFEFVSGDNDESLFYDEENNIVIETSKPKAKKLKTVSIAEGQAADISGNLSPKRQGKESPKKMYTVSPVKSIVPTGMQMKEQVVHFDITSSDDSSAVNSELSAETKVDDKVVKKLKEDYDFFPSGYQLLGSQWCRDKLFSFSKFYIEENSGTAIKCLATYLDLKGEDPVKYFKAMGCLISTCLTAKRNYITKKLKAHLRGKFFGLYVCPYEFNTNIIYQRFVDI
jgi:hypothetical protein